MAGRAQVVLRQEGEASEGEARHEKLMLADTATQIQNSKLN